MRLFTVTAALLVLGGCASYPDLRKEHEFALTSISEARIREVDLIAENIALKRQVEKLAQEIGEANAQILALRARVGEGATTSSPAVAEEKPPKTSASPDPATGTTSSGRTVHTGPRGGQYTISPSGNKQYIRRR
jgi:hypothetical protein